MLFTNKTSVNSRTNAKISGVWNRMEPSRFPGKILVPGLIEGNLSKSLKRSISDAMDYIERMSCVK